SGVSNDGREVAHGEAPGVLGAVDWMQRRAAIRALAALPPGSDEDTRRRVERATRERALESLVAILNRLVPEEQDQVTGASLLDRRRTYSLEFRLYVAEYARYLAGDDRFFY